MSSEEAQYISQIAEACGALTPERVKVLGYDGEAPPQREAVAIAEQAFGREDPAFSEALNNLAWVVGSAGRYEEAEAMHREALRLRSHAPGAGSEPHFLSACNLAWALWQTGRHRDAQDILDAAAEARRTFCKAGDPAVADALLMIARFHRDEGDTDIALDFYHRAAELLRNAAGPPIRAPKSSWRSSEALQGSRSRVRRSCNEHEAT